MKFSNRRDIKYTTLSLSSLQSFAELLTDVALKDNESDNYKKEPIFEVEYFDGSKYRTEDHQEFIDQIKNNIKVKRMLLYYSGNNVNIRFNSSQSFTGGWADLEIGADVRGKLLEYEERILSYFGRKSWNWIFHNFFSMLVISGLAWIPFVFMLSNYTVKDLTPLVWIFPAFGFVLDAVTVRAYPNLVIEDGNRHSGRVIKDDSKYLFLILLLPIFINWFTDH